jgi:hypothetical protein
MNKIKINEEFLKTSLEEFKAKVLQENAEILSTYKNNFEQLSMAHELYRHNWRISFLDNHRYMNWIIYTFLKNAADGSCPILFNSPVFKKDFTVMDIGCYDSCLVKILNDNGVKAYGYDDNSWDEMFDLLNTKNDINNCACLPEVAIMLNYAHNFHPDKLLQYVEEKCGHLPSILFFDFDANVKHLYQHLYYDRGGEFEMVKFSDYKERELFIWVG